PTRSSLESAATLNSNSYYPKHSCASTTTSLNSRLAPTFRSGDDSAKPMQQHNPDNGELLRLICP
ncbi:unnamed protein product, partial [Anisakis simplex]|uniref:Uncharacterized protein n=1 Tax=Anisakis simplex TaxID=6269 RepID=A0A0M3KE23_ANISI